MEGLKLANLPSDALQPILALLPAESIVRLYICGDIGFMNRMSSQDLVTNFYCVPRRPGETFPWPSIVSTFSHLKSLVLHMPLYYEHIPISNLKVESLPQSITHLSFQFGNANYFCKTLVSKLPHLRHCRFDGSLPIRGMIDTPENLQSFELPGFQATLTGFGSLTTLLGDIQMSMGELASLPPTLTKLALVMITGWASAEEPEAFELPPNLVLFHSRRAAPSYFLLKHLPQSLTDLRMDINDRCEWSPLPPNLETLRLHIESGSGPSAIRSLWEHLPKKLGYLKIVGLEALEGDFAQYFPATLTSFLACNLGLRNSQLCSLPSSLNCLRVAALAIDLPNTAVPVPPSLVSLRLDQRRVAPFPILPVSTRRLKLRSVHWGLDVLPPHLTELDVVQGIYETHFDTRLLPSSLTSLKLGSFSRVQFEGQIIWPSGLTSLSLSNFNAPDFFDLPPTLISLSVHQFGTTDVEVALKKIPPSLVFLSLPAVDISDEQATRLPRGLVRLNATLILSAAGIIALPKTLRYCGKMEGSPRSDLLDLFPDHTEVKWAVSW